MHYFAYGSNMSAPRLRRRVPSALIVGVAVLQGHRLMFHKAGRDGSAKCDAAASLRLADRVHGVLYRMDPGHRPRLDEAEGLGEGYARKTVSVQRADGGHVVAFTYYATQIDPTLRPYSWYLEHVMQGVREHGLPHGYAATIAKIATAEDPDLERQQKELAIYVTRPLEQQSEVNPE